MSKAVRIIALIMAILLGLSAIGMIAMYVAAETPDAVGVSVSLPTSETEDALSLSKASLNPVKADL